MGSSSSKFRKHLQHGDEYAALQLYNNNSDLRKALDPNLSYGETYNHDTPLHFAARHSMKALLRIFLYELGGNPNKKNNHNENSLHCVCMVANSRAFTVQQRRLECLTLILQWRGAMLKDGEIEKVDVGAQDEKLNTALHYAAASGLTRCVELLVAYNSPLFMENAQKQTPCDCAEKCGNSNIALYLESKMVFSNENNGEQDEEVEAVINEINNQEAYSGLRAQDLQEAKDQLLVETSDMLRVPLFTAEALLRNHEWSREQLLEAWMEDAIACCDKCGVTPPPSVFAEKPGISDANHGDLSLQNRVMFQADIVCDICACVIPGTEEPVLMSCEHQFCRGCWERYLNGKIQEGEIHNIMCPAFECGKLVPVDVIEKVVSRDMARRYLQFDIKAFVDSNPNIKWCPFPGCGRAVRLPESETTSPTTTVGLHIISSDTSHAVDCGNGHYFCWECLGEAHEPCSCENWTKWFEKIQEVKPEELTNTAEETEHAANYLWLVTNSKPCPNCKSPIQKNEGCNHMKCSKCKHDFCWVCLEAWKKHSSATGGYFRCNRYEVVKKNEEETSELKSEAEARNRRMQELNRFMHYYSRYKNHEHSYKLEEPLLSTAKEKMMILAKAVTDPETANMETKFVEDAVRQLLKARRVLKCSYIYGYYLDDTGYKKTIFEFMQTELEECLESLSQMIARPYLRTPRGRIIQTSNLVQRKRHEFVTAISKGLIPPDTSPNFRRKRRKELDEDLRKALLASIQDVDPNNPWVKDKSGRHTNVAAFLDWPVDESDDSDSEPIGTPPSSAIVESCVRRGCMKARAQNPRTGASHDHCSLRCMKLDRLDRSESEDSDPSEFFTDYQMDLLRAMEMSRLQFLREMGGLAGPGPSGVDLSDTHSPSSFIENINEAGPSSTSGGKSPNLVKKSREKPTEEADTEFQQALILSRLSMISNSPAAPPEEDQELKLAIELSLKDKDESGTHVDQVKKSERGARQGAPQHKLPDSTPQIVQPVKNVAPKIPVQTADDVAGHVPEVCVPSPSSVDACSPRSPRSPRTPVSPLPNRDKFQYLGACGGGSGVSEPAPSPTQKFLSVDPSTMLETSFIPSTTGSSQFGHIKDLSVANIASSDRDKTEDFKNKTFNEIFNHGTRHTGKSFNLNLRKSSKQEKSEREQLLSPEQISLKLDDPGKKNRSEAQVMYRKHRKEDDKQTFMYRRHSSSHAEDQGHSNVGKRNRFSEYSEGSLHGTPRKKLHQKGREWKCYSYTGYEPDTGDVWVPRTDAKYSQPIPPPPPPPSATSKSQPKESNLESMLKKLIVPQDDEDEVFYDSSSTAAEDGATIVEQWDHSPQRSPRPRNNRRSRDDDDDTDNFPGAVFV